MSEPNFLEGIRNYKPRDHKEHIYAQPAVLATRLEKSLAKSWISLREMKPCHRNRGDSSQRIHRTDATGLGMHKVSDVSTLPGRRKALLRWYKDRPKRPFSPPSSSPSEDRSPTVRIVRALGAHLDCILHSDPASDVVDLTAMVGIAWRRGSG